MEELVFEGKTYSVIDQFEENVFLNVGILTFDYFPHDKILIATKSFADFFKCDRFLPNMPDSLADCLIHQDDRVIIYEMEEEALKGNKRIAANLRTKAGYLSHVTLTATKIDENQRVISMRGIVQKIESDILSTKTLEALTYDYGSVYYVDLEKNKVFPHRMSAPIEKEYGAVLRLNPPFEKIIKVYIENNVLDLEKKEMEYICSLENLKNQFADKNIYVHDYRAVRNGSMIFCRMKVVNLSEKGELKYFSIGFSDMSAKKTFELRRYAYIDGITGGNNYHSFRKKLAEINIPGLIISMDIYEFRVINKICGPKRGNDVLRRVWEISNLFYPKNSVLCRVNSDVFAVYIPECTDETAKELIQEISSALQKLSSEMGVPKIIPYFGISKWDKDKDIETVLSETMFAKNEIKKRKDSNYLFYTEDEAKKVLIDKSLEDNFASALENEEFEVWYQPKFNPEKNELIGAEALVRWRKKNGSLLPPVSFVSLFESDGLIKKLDEYVFEKVCQVQKSRLDAGKNILPISVNLSRTSVYFDNVVSQYSEIAKSTGIAPEFVPIEITESAAVSSKEVQDIMQKFHEAGFLVFMDDFGTGYSSLSALNTFPFDTLKIDKSLIDFIGDEKGDILLKHVFSMSKELGIHITAEGVESENQVEFLKKLKCDSIQGYYYSKPLPFEEFCILYK